MVLVFYCWFNYQNYIFIQYQELIRTLNYSRIFIICDEFCRVRLQRTNINTSR